MTKNALCIGINDYPGTESDLSGCVNDANDWKAALKDRGFTVRLLQDSDATKEAMVREIRNLVTAAQSGDAVVITYSGHGSWVPDLDGDEPDARDEVLCPYDIAQNRPLIDDEIHALFGERAKGVRIALITDSCHSGSVLRFAPAVTASKAARVRFLPPQAFLPQRTFRVAARAFAILQAPAHQPYGGVLLSGCQDTEYSYDAYFGNRPNGAFTYFALKSLKELPADATYCDWHKAIRAYLPSALYPQTPNLVGTKAQTGWRVLE
jgi:hypothetical protein